MNISDMFQLNIGGISGKLVKLSDMLRFLLALKERYLIGVHIF